MLIFCKLQLLGAFRGCNAALIRPNGDHSCCEWGRLRQMLGGKMADRLLDWTPVPRTLMHTSRKFWDEHWATSAWLNLILAKRLQLPEEPEVQGARRPRIMILKLWGEEWAWLPRSKWAQESPPAGICTFLLIISAIQWSHQSMPDGHRNNDLLNPFIARFFLKSAFCGPPLPRIPRTQFKNRRIAWMS